ncbi:hypothetical protein E4U54_003417, partial [Claviceps lovelessii]
MLGSKEIRSTGSRRSHADGFDVALQEEEEGDDDDDDDGDDEESSTRNVRFCFNAAGMRYANESVPARTNVGAFVTDP